MAASCQCLGYPPRACSAVGGRAGPRGVRKAGLLHPPAHQCSGVCLSIQVCLVKCFWQPGLLVEISQEIPLRVRQAHRQAGFSTCSVHSGLPSVARLKVLLRCSGPLRPAGSLGQQAAKDMGHSFMCSPMQARASTGCSNVSPYLMVQAATSTSSPSHAKPT